MILAGVHIVVFAFILEIICFILTFIFDKSTQDYLWRYWAIGIFISALIGCFGFASILFGVIQQIIILML